MSYEMPYIYLIAPNEYLKIDLGDIERCMATSLNFFVNDDS